MTRPPTSLETYALIVVVGAVAIVTGHFAWGLVTGGW